MVRAMPFPVVFAHAASAAMLLLLSTIGKAAGAPVRDPRDKPNFIMLFVDDLGYGDCGFTGHPTTRTPNLDRLAAGGKVLTTWYSGCPVCSGSRASLMTGRHWARVGVPPVFSPNAMAGLPLNETTIAEMLKKQNYTTGMMGKWHLGQREVYLPGNRGFDHYLGIPYSDDMGLAKATSCSSTTPAGRATGNPFSEELIAQHNHYRKLGYDVEELVNGPVEDPGSKLLPLVLQENGKTKVLEQPLDFTYLAEQYNSFVVDFVHRYKDTPFFLYMAFSHVHVCAKNQPTRHYSGCAFKNQTSRGPFGDAFMESDWLVGNAYKAVVDAGIEENTLFLFSSDNGPWMVQGSKGGSVGLFTGRFSGYWNVGKGSTWEGGIREPAFAYWKGQISPSSRSEAVVSSMDVFPTLAALAKVPLSPGQLFDGRDMTDVLLKEDGKSAHKILFFYGGCMPKGQGPSAARYGMWKAHWCTGQGLEGDKNATKFYLKVPLLFEIDVDPSEAEPVNPNGEMPTSPEAQAAIKELQDAYELEKKTFTWGTLVPEPLGPGESKDRICVCCDRAKNCDCNGTPSSDLFAKIEEPPLEVETV